MKLAVLFSALVLTATTSAQVNIIPQPVEITVGTSYLIIKQPVAFIYNDYPPTNGGVSFFKDYLKKFYKISQFKTGDTHSHGLPTEIFVDYEKNYPVKDGYELIADKKGITVRGNETGLFYAFQTLIQLLPVPNTISQSPNSKIQIPFVTIKDYPRFQYRGLHLDVGRHFMPVDFIKKYIDYIALHKMNYFHWHLTEDQGWRIEIKKYPNLTKVGGWRNGTIIERYPGNGNDNIKYGGFYTQEQVKEIVKYAADRYITVIPEIELPGHSSAAIAAYPSLSCFPDEPTKIPENMISKASQGTKGKLVQETWGVFDDVFCAGKDETFNFLQDIMDEVLALFPAKYIHVGGDECPKANWKRCLNCQKRMKDNNLKDEHELQSYFIQRMEKYLTSKGKILVGWDEILEGGLAPKAIVMSWRGEEGGIAAAKENHEVIMTPGSHVYLDHSQSENEDSVTIGGYTTVEKIYSYEPIPAALNEAQGKYVLGAQGNVWTEYMKNTKKVEYMIFPRLSALSEVLWSPKQNRNWSGFEKRLQTQFKRYKSWKVNYSEAYFDLKTAILPTKDNDGVSWKIQSKYSRDACEYCYIQAEEEFIYKKDTIIIDTVGFYGSPDATTIKGFKTEKNIIKAGSKGKRGVNDPYINDTLLLLKINESTTVAAWQRFHHTKGSVIEQKFNFNKATGKKITLAHEPSKNYPGDGAFTLVNGVQNEKGLARSREFLGFSGTDCEALIDVGSTQEISEVVVHTLSSGGSWVHPPRYAEVFASADGVNFTSVGKGEKIEITGGSNGVIKIACRTSPVRYLKIFVKNYGIIPEGIRGAGNPAWLFVDEIEVN